MDDIQSINSYNMADKNLVNRLTPNQTWQYSQKMAVPKAEPVSQFVGASTVQTQSGGPGNHLPISAPAANPACSVPLSGANGVNIVIYNPTVQPPNGNSNTTNNYNTTQMAYPKEYYTKELVQQPVAAQQVSPQAAVPQPQAQIAATKATEPVKKEEKKEKEIVVLTDDYVKSLENYIKNPNPEIRMMGVQELSKRFSEDESRRNDAALTSLLNVSLQDDNDNVRIRALSMLDGGFAQGDSFTVQILNSIQNKKQRDKYDETTKSDALLASEILLKLAGTKVKVPDNSPVKKEQAKG